jgi:hypothetical protein
MEVLTNDFLTEPGRLGDFRHVMPLCHETAVAM